MWPGKISCYFTLDTPWPVPLFLTAVSGFSRGEQADRAVTALAGGTDEEASPVGADRIREVRDAMG
jgi:hypothetical protein